MTETTAGDNGDNPAGNNVTTLRDDSDAAAGDDGNDTAAGDNGNDTVTGDNTQRRRPKRRQLSPNRRRLNRNAEIGLPGDDFIRPHANNTIDLRYVSDITKLSNLKSVYA